jgi:hypothetical protein
MANESLVMTASVRDDFSSTLRKLQNDLRSLSTTGNASTKALQKEWKGVNEQFEGASLHMRRDLIPAIAAGTFIGQNLGSAIGYAARALKDFAQNTSTMANFSKEIGLSTKELSKFQALGNFFGLDPATLQGNLRTFQDFMNRLKNDTGRTISELRSTFGVAGDELASKLLNANSMKEAADIAFEAIKSTGNESKARAIAQAVFGNESWARIIRNATPEVLAEISKIQSKIDENKDAADRFNLAMLKFTTTLTNFSQQAMTPLLGVTSNLMEKFGDKSIDAFGRSIESVDKFAKSLAESFGAVVGWIKQIEEFTSSSGLGALVGMIPKPGGGAAVAGTASATTGAGTPGSPVKTLEKSNDDLKRSTDELKRSTDKQTSILDKIVGSFGQGTEAGGLGPGLGAVSAGGGGAGVLSRFRDAIAGGMGGIGPAGRMGGGGGAGGPVDPAQLEMFKKMGGMPTPQQTEQVLSAMKPNMDPMAPAGTAPGGGPMTTVTTAGGRKFTVASAYAENFRGFLNDYEKAGGVIGPSSGGLAGRPGNASYHPLGRAIDLNQVGYGIRAKTGSTLPREVEDSLAAKWGLYPGSRFGDIGHFEVRNAQMARAALEAQGKAVGSGPVGQGSVPPPNPNAPGHLGLRNFNFGNLKYGMGSANKYEGVVGPSQGRDDGDQQIVFKSMEHGIKAAEKLALDKAGQGKNTIAKLVAERGGWTPGNMIAARNIAKSMGVGVHDEVDMTNADTRTNFLKALGKQEQLPGKALDDALGKVEGVVKGGKVDATGTVNIHISGDHKNSNVKASTDGMFKDVNVNRGKPMGTAEDLTPLNRASAGF